MNSPWGGGLGNEVIGDILKDINPFYQEIQRGEHTQVHESLLWTTLKDLLEDKKTDWHNYHRFCSSTNTAGVVWSIVSHLMRQRQ
jgi:hypothetical protein